MNANLFVYGTLRADSRYDGAPDLSNFGVLIGKATMQGSLYRVGRYPGMIDTRNRERTVVGEVYRMHHPRRAFGILDAYEGREFERTLKRATLESGESLDAWVYLYGLNVRYKPRIPSGDFLAPKPSRFPCGQ